MNDPTPSTTSPSRNCRRKGVKRNRQM